MFNRQLIALPFDRLSSYQFKSANQFKGTAFPYKGTNKLENRCFVFFVFKLFWSFECYGDDDVLTVRRGIICNGFRGSTDVFAYSNDPLYSHRTLDCLLCESAARLNLVLGRFSPHSISVISAVPACRPNIARASISAPENSLLSRTPVNSRRAA